MRRLRNLIAGLLAALGGCWPTASAPVFAQTPTYLAPRFIQVKWSASVRDSLARAWNDNDPNQVERTACLSYRAYMGERATFVIEITGFAPDSQWFASPYASGFVCHAALRLHTHTPATCAKNDEGAYVHCRPGGDDAWECGPSPDDVWNLRYVHDAVAFIQCDRHAIIMYFPSTTPHG